MNLLSIIGILLIGLMFFVPRAWKISLIMISIICLSLVHVPFPGTSLTIVLCYCFLLSELKNISKLCKCIQKNRTILLILFVQLIATLISYITSPHYFGQLEGTKTIIIELLTYNVLIAYSYYAFRRKNDVRILLYSTFGALIFTTICGILNLLLHQADFVNFAIDLNKETSANIIDGDSFTLQNRFRVQATFDNPFDYGYICMMLVALHTYGFLKKLENKWMFITALLCCLFGIFMCGCRTMIFCSVFGAVIFCILRYNVTKILKYLPVAILCPFILYILVPVFQEKVNSTIVAVVDPSSADVEGSSLEMRALQFVVVLGYVQEDPLFGRGRDFFTVDLGWADGEQSAVDKDLWGLEGVYLVYLLERGIIGFFLWVVIYIVLFRYFFKSKSQAFNATSIGLTVLTLYVTFSMLTGELSSLRPTMILTGLFMKMVERESRRHKYIIQKSIKINLPKRKKRLLINEVK